MFQLNYRKERITQGLKIILFISNDHRYNHGSYELDLTSFLFWSTLLHLSTLYFEAKIIS
jgi:hypothetical protein